jgi:hypothetical protein
MMIRSVAFLAVFAAASAACDVTCTLSAVSVAQALLEKSILTVLMFCVLIHRLKWSPSLTALNARRRRTVASSLSPAANACAMKMKLR